MNKRRRAQTFSLLLVFLMVLSVVPVFAPGFLKPVSAAAVINYNVTVKTYLNNTTLVQEPFVGYPAKISVNVTATLSGANNVQPIVDNITVYFNESGKLVNVSTMPYQVALQPTPNTTNEYYGIFNFTLPAIPTNVSNIVIQVVSGSGTIVKTVNVSTKEITSSTLVSIESSVPVNESGTVTRAYALKNVPFNLTLNVALNSSLVSAYPSLLPSASNITGCLFANGTKIATVYNVTFDSTTGVYTLKFVNVTTSYVGTLTLFVKDLLHGLNFTFPLNGTSNTVYVYNWYLNVTPTIKGEWGNTNLGGIFKLVPFNVTFTVTANSSLGKVLVNTTGTFKLEGASKATPTSGTFNFTNGVGTVKIYNVSADPLVVTFSLPSYGIAKTVNITTYNWTVNVNVTDIYLYGENTPGYVLTPSQSGFGFYKDIPANMLVTFNYTNGSTLVKINSTATVKVLYGDQVIWTGTVNVTNGEGQVYVNLTNVSFVPSNVSRKIEVIVEDNNYEKWGHENLNIYYWNISSSFIEAFLFGNSSSPSRYFIVNIPANMTFSTNFMWYKVTTEKVLVSQGCCGYKYELENETVLGGLLPFVPKTKLNVTITGPGVHESFLLNVTSPSDVYAISKLLKFNATGSVTVTIRDTEYHHVASFTVEVLPIKSTLSRVTTYPFGKEKVYCCNAIEPYFISHVPSNLTYTITVLFPIDQAYVNVTFIGPNGERYGPFKYYVNTTNGGLYKGSYYSYVYLNVSKLMKFNESGYVTVLWSMLIFADNNKYNTTISGEGKIPVNGWPGVVSTSTYMGQSENNFLIGIPQNLSVYLEGTLYFPINVNVSVTVTGPNYTKTITESYNYNDTCNANLRPEELFSETLNNLVFNRTGNVTVYWKVTYWSNEYNITPFSISGERVFPVEKWYVQFSVSPNYLEVGQTTMLDVNVGSYPVGDIRTGNHVYNVTVILPNGERFSNLTSSISEWANYWGLMKEAFILIPGQNITVPGVAEVIVSDVATHGLVKSVQYIPVYPNVVYTKKYINVTVTPSKTYEYETTDLTVHLQYMGSNGNITYPIDTNSLVQLMVISNNTVVYNETIPLHNNNGEVIVHGIKLDALGSVYVYARDLTNSSIRGVAEVEVMPWHVNVTFAPTSIYKYVPVNLTVNVVPNVTAISQSHLKVYINGKPYTGGFEIMPVDTTSYTVTVYYVSDLGNSYLIYNKTYTVNVEPWEIKVQEHPLYASSSYENSLVFPFEYVTASGKVVPFTGVANVTLTLPNGKTLNKLFNVTNGKGIIDFGKAIINETRNVTITVVQFIEDGKYNVTGVTVIPVRELLNITKVEPETVYAGVKTPVKVYVYSGPADYKNITVTLDNMPLKYAGTMTYRGETVGVYTANITLEAGNYTVIVRDALYNVTKTAKVTSVGWKLTVAVSPTDVSIGSYTRVNITVRTVLASNSSEPANLSDVANVAISFSNKMFISPLTNQNVSIPIKEGRGTKTVNIYVPASGYFTINVTDEYGKTASATIKTVEPKTLTWIYVNIRLQGSLKSPSVPSVIYYSFDNSTGPYIAAYDFIHNRTVNGTTEAVFPIAPTRPYDLYVIAVPSSFAVNHSVIYLSTNKTYVWTTTNSSVKYSYGVKALSKRSWLVSIDVRKYTTLKTYTYKLPTSPGMIPIAPQSSSVQGNAIATPLVVKVSQIENPPYIKNFTVIVLPDARKLTLLNNMSIKPAQAGSYFEFMVQLYVKNATKQINEQLQMIKEYVDNITYINTTVKDEMMAYFTKELMSNASVALGPVAGANVTFHISNTSIAYVEPTSAITNANGTVTFKVYSKATANMTPEQLKKLMGTVSVWATYDNLTTNTITVTFGGAGAISGDITDNTGRQVPGVTVVVKYWNGSAWVNATDFNGNVLKTVSASDGHYAISDVPAAVNGTKYLVEAVYGNYTGYAYVTVYPFTTSTADIKLSGTVSSNSSNSNMNATSMGLSEYPTMVNNASNVFVVFNNYGTADAFSVSTYMSQTIHNPHVHYLPVSSFNMSYVNAGDVIISIGGPLVNPITAMYENISKAKMVVNGTTILIETPNETFTWVPPKPWYNVTEGYFIIEMFKDNTTGAIVVTIYGTDASSTAAGAYYFANVIYPNIAAYQNVTTIVGKWINTNNASVPVFVYPNGVPLNFDPGDTIQVVYEG